MLADECLHPVQSARGVRGVGLAGHEAAVGALVELMARPAVIVSFMVASLGVQTILFAISDCIIASPATRSIKRATNQGAAFKTESADVLACISSAARRQKCRDSHATLRTAGVDRSCRQ